MKSIKIEISTYPENKIFRGIYLNNSLVSEELSYSTNLVNTLLGSNYNFKVSFGDIGSRLLMIDAESSDISAINLHYNNVVQEFNLPYSTNTMASSITLDMTGLIPVGYTFDGYYSGSSLLSSNLSYVVPIDFESSAGINISIHTTPHVVVPVSYTAGGSAYIQNNPLSGTSTNAIYDSLQTNVVIGSFFPNDIPLFTLFDNSSTISYNYPITVNNDDYSIDSPIIYMGKSSDDLHFFLATIGHDAARNISYKGTTLNVSGENKTTAPSLSVAGSEAFNVYYLGTKLGSITGNVGGAILAKIQVSSPEFSLATWSSYNSSENFIVTESEFEGNTSGKNALGIALSTNTSYELQVKVDPESPGVGLTLSSATIAWDSSRTIKHTSISGNIIKFTAENNGTYYGKGMLIIQASTYALPNTYNFSAEAPVISQIKIGGTDRTLPYSTNTASNIAIDVTGKIPLGYGYDGIYKDNILASSSLSYTLPYSYSTSPISIQIKTTPWVLGNLTLTMPVTSSDYSQGNLTLESPTPRVLVLSGDNWKNTNLNSLASGSNSFEIQELSPASPTTGSLIIVSTSESYWPSASGVTIPSQLKGITVPANFNNAPLPVLFTGNNVTLSTTTFPTYIGGGSNKDYQLGVGITIPAISGETAAALGSITANFNFNSTYIKIGTLEGSGDGVTAKVTTGNPVITVGGGSIADTSFDIAENTFIGYLYTNNSVGAFTIEISTGTDSQASYIVSSASLKHSGGTTVSLSVSSNYITIPTTTVAAGKAVSINIEGSFVYMTKSFSVSAESSDIKQVKVNGYTENLPYSTSLTPDD